MTAGSNQALSDIAKENSRLEQEKLRAELEAVKLGDEKLKHELKGERLRKWAAFGAGAVSAIVAVASH